MSDDDPFEELDVEPLDPDADDADEELADLFTEVEVGEVDDEAIWAELTGEADGESAGDDEVTAEAASLPQDDGEGTVVPKASYCQQCEHFSAPPEVACENPGTEIVELVDVKHFRVRNCPVVSRRSSATRDISEDD